MSSTFSQVWGALAPILFAFSIVFFVFLFGVGVGYYKFFPFTQLHSARVSAGVIFRHFIGDTDAGESFASFTDIPRKDLAKHRVATLATVVGATEALLFTGGANQFLDYCPSFGCVAIELRRDGTLIHAWPFRPTEFEKTPIVSENRETLLFDVSRNIYSGGLSKLQDGSLIAVFFATQGFPSGGGVARIAPDGHFMWFRRDFSHHWPIVTGDEIIVAAAQVRSQPTPVVIDGVTVGVLDCKPAYIADAIRIIDLNGRLKKEISVFNALLASPYRGVVLQTLNKCDPLHVNSVTPVGAELASTLPGVAAGDFVVSMRHISAIGIVSRSSGRLLRFYRGNFFMQHSVLPYRGSKVIMFDNLGASLTIGPSRLLVYDLLTGAEETLFPTPQSKFVPFFSEKNGTVSLSSDRMRAIVAATDIGKGYELRLSDGAILTKFDNLSDVSKANRFDDRGKRFAARFKTFGIFYAREN